MGSVASMQRIDLSDATFTEATASGNWNVIRDFELRALISVYYFNAARYRNTGGARVDAQWQAFQHLLAESGLSGTGGGTDEEILSALRASPRLVAELRNLRNLAAYQLQYLEIVLNAADPLKLRIDGAGS